MNANELANLLEVDSWYKLVTREEIAIMLRQQQAEIEALKNGFNTTWAGTNNSEMAEVRAMANRCILKIQELEFEQEGFENLVEMLESEKEELVEKTRQQQAEIEALKQQVAFLEDWRDTWSPTIKQFMNINVKAQENG